MTHVPEVFLILHNVHFVLLRALFLLLAAALCWIDKSIAVKAYLTVSACFLSLFSNNGVFSFMLHFPPWTGKGTRQQLLFWNLYNIYSLVLLCVLYLFKSIYFYTSAVLMIPCVNVTFSIWYHLQGFCLCGSRQPDSGSEVSCFPLRLTCQEHRHQPAWDVFKGQPPSHIILDHGESSAMSTMNSVLGIHIFSLPSFLDNAGEKGEQTGAEPAELWPESTCHPHWR